MSKVSVIIPVYNAEKYIQECMESVLNQTLRDIEIICINDGSTDHSGNILEGFANEDSRVKVIHKSNSGYGDSVNKGIEESSGEYIGIVEPDDYIAWDMYEKLYNQAIEEKLEVVKGNFVQFSGEGEGRIFIPQKIINNKDYYGRVITPIIDKELFRGCGINPSGVYNRKFLDTFSIRHNTTPGASYQDIGFWFQIMIHAKRVKLIDLDVYYYRQDNSESSVNNREKVFCICDEYEFLKERIFRLKERNRLLFGYLTECMFINYSFSLNRIGAESKKVFVKKFSQDFWQLKKEGLLCMDMMKETEKQSLCKIMNQPQEYTKEIMYAANLMHRELSKYKHAYIYGAGVFGVKVLKNLYLEDLKKISGFVVTDTAGNVKRLQGYEVKSLSEFLNLQEEAAVIIGVSGGYKEEVNRTLRDYGIKDIIDPML